MFLLVDKMVKIFRTQRFYRIRLKEPDKRHYKKFRIKQIDGFKAVIGIKRKEGPRGGKTEITSLIVPKKMGKRKVRKLIKEFA